jgi:S-adenosylmethionine hydrolase
VEVSVRRIIALITDYGYRDPYVGVVKGVIKSINPDAEIVDLTHGIERHNVLEAAVMLAVSAEYFPPGTIFVVVVDPGVGGLRKAIVVETTHYVLVGPDNGCLTLLAEKDGVKRVIDISRTKYRLPVVSHTYHGRDIFAPVAAWISRGVPLEELGEEISYEDLVKLSIERPNVDINSKAMRGRVLYIDVFGNVMTNITSGEVNELNLKLGVKLLIRVDSKSAVCTYETTFSKVPVGDFVCYVNSWGYLEVAVNMGSAAEKLRVKQGDVVFLTVLE